MLVRAFLRTGRDRSGKAHPLRVQFPSLTAFVRFRVALHRLPGGSAALRDRGYRALELDGAAAEGHDVSGTDAVRWPNPGTIDVYLAAAHRLRRQGPRLEEAYAEEPAIDTRGAQETCRPPLMTARQGLKPHQ